jgi:hypothetical protein
MRKLKWISENEACWLLSILGAARHMVSVYETNQAAEFVTPGDTLRNPRSERRMAVLRKIRFFGGPPGWRQYQHGNWVMYVIDRLLFVQVKWGIGFKWVLEFDNANPKHIREQLAGRVPRQLLLTPAGQRFESTLGCNLVANGSEGSTPSPNQQMFHTLPTGATRAIV